MLIRIRQGKGEEGSQRHAQPEGYYRNFCNYRRAANPKPETYLFPSKGTHPNGDVPITSKSVYGMPCSKRGVRAGLDKRR